jgi:hypothetical protein
VLGVIVAGMSVSTGVIVSVRVPVAVGVTVSVGLGTTVCARALTVSTTGFVGLLAETGKDCAPVGKLQDDKTEANKMVNMTAGPIRVWYCGVLSMTSPIKNCKSSQYFV